MSKVNVLRNSNIEIMGKLSLNDSYSENIFITSDKMFEKQEELQEKSIKE